MSQIGSPRGQPCDANGVASHGNGYLDVAGVTKQTLIEAIANFLEGLAPFEADNRLVLCNYHFQDFQPGLEAVVDPGATLQSIARVVADSCIARLEGLTAEA